MSDNDSMSSVSLDQELEKLFDENLELTKQAIQLRRIRPQQLKHKFLKEQNDIIEQFIVSHE